MILWEKKYETGVAEIDEQHQWLFNFANTLEDQLRDDSKDADIALILKSLKYYALQHFDYEENCMVSCNCPAAANNKSAHDHFIFAYENFMERYTREGHSKGLAWKIHAVVEQWITSHICKIDVKLKKCQVSE